MKYKILKRIGFWLFLSAFILNVVFTSYAYSMVKTYNTGAEIIEGVGAMLSGGGPFFALVGASLLAAGLVCEAVSDDPTDGALEYFVSDCIVNDHFANSALEVIYRDLVIDEDGNISYKQVIDNINAYVEVNNIVISTGAAVEFKNNMLYVAPEIVNAMAHDVYDFYRDKHLSPFSSIYENGGVSFGVIRGVRLNIKYNGFNDLMNYLNTNDLPYVVFLENQSVFPNFRVLCAVDNESVLNSLGFSSVATSIRVGLNTSRPWFFVYGDNVEPYHYVYSLYGVNYWTVSGGFESDNLFSLIDYKSSYTVGRNILYYWNNADFLSDFTDLISVPDVSDNLYVPFPVVDVYDYDSDVSGIFSVDIPTDIDRDNLILDLPVSDFPIVVDDGMVNDLDEAFKNVIGVVEGLGEDAVEKDKVITDSISNTLEGVLDNAQEREDENIKNPSVPSVPSVGFPEVGELKTDGLIDKFPFCIPFDLISLIEAFEAEPEAPHVEIPVLVPVFGVSDNIVIDFSDFEYLARIFRALEVVGFTLFLILKTRELIKG